MDTQAQADLARLLGDRFVSDSAQLEAHGRDASPHPAAAPEAVAYPLDTAEVQEIVRICGRTATPLIPYGAGSSLEGGTLATMGGLAVDMTRMNAIRTLHAADQDVVVEAGVTRLQLAAKLKDSGLFFSVDPGADATLGGMASTGAAGTNTVRYGTIRDNVLALEVVLADGSVIRTGSRARKSSAGYDLTRLLIGAEGTLGIITELTLRLRPLPRAIAAAICAFDSVSAAVTTVTRVVTAGIPVARAELLDTAAIEAVNRHASLSNPAAPTLFLEFHGSASAVQEQARDVQALAHEMGGTKFRWATQESERLHLWQARHDAYHAIRALRPQADVFSTDVCVPIDALAACIDETLTDRDSLSLQAPVVGHVGDGNFHCLVLVDREQPQEIEAALGFQQRLVGRALACGGTCSGEHGVGIGKRAFLRAEHGAAVDTMQALKRTLDPQGLFNPGKIF